MQSSRVSRLHSDRVLSREDTAIVSWRCQPTCTDVHGGYELNDGSDDCIIFMFKRQDGCVDTSFQKCLLFTITLIQFIMV